MERGEVVVGGWGEEVRRENKTPEMGREIRKLVLVKNGKLLVQLKGVG